MDFFEDDFEFDELALQEAAKKKTKDTWARNSARKAISQYTEMHDVRNCENFIDKVFHDLAYKKYENEQEIRKDIKRCDKLLADIKRERARIASKSKKDTKKVLANQALFSLHFIMRGVRHLIYGTINFSLYGIFPTPISTVLRISQTFKTHLALAEDFERFSVSVIGYRYLLIKYETSVKGLRDSLEDELKHFKKKKSRLKESVYMDMDFLTEDDDLDLEPAKVSYKVPSEDMDDDDDDDIDIHYQSPEELRSGPRPSVFHDDYDMDDDDDIVSECDDSFCDDDIKSNSVFYNKMESDDIFDSWDDYTDD